MRASCISMRPGRTGFVLVFNTTTDGDAVGRDAGRFDAMMRAAYGLLVK